MIGLLGWVAKKILLGAIYEKILIVVIEDGMGHFVKKTESKVDDKLLKIVVDALKA